jgi:hypothetical protein
MTCRATLIERVGLVKGDGGCQRCCVVRCPRSVCEKCSGVGLGYLGELGRGR